MNDWTEYLNSMINFLRKKLSNFRKTHPEIPNKISELPMLIESFPTPCQIKVFDFGPEKIIWQITFNEEKKDKEFTIYENIKEIPKEFPKYMEEAYSFLRDTKSYTLTSLKLVIYRSHESEGHFYLFFKDPRKDFTPEEIAEIFIERLKPFLLLSVSKHQVEKTAKSMEQKISALKEDPARSDLLKSLGKLETYIKKTNELQDAVRGVRTLIGASEEFKDWKILVSDVGKIKEEHVNKAIFESEIKRLTDKIDSFEKIENAYERLSSQQEKVLEQQSDFLKWIKYSTILVPIAVALIPIIEILVKDFLNIS